MSTYGLTPDLSLDAKKEELRRKAAKEPTPEPKPFVPSDKTEEKAFADARREAAAETLAQRPGWDSAPGLTSEQADQIRSDLRRYKRPRQEGEVYDKYGNLVQRVVPPTAVDLPGPSGAVKEPPGMTQKQRDAWRAVMESRKKEISEEPYIAGAPGPEGVYASPEHYRRVTAGAPTEVPPIDERPPGEWPKRYGLESPDIMEAVDPETVKMWAEIGAGTADPRIGFAIDANYFNKAINEGDWLMGALSLGGMAAVGPPVGSIVKAAREAAEVAPAARAAAPVAEAAVRAPPPTTLEEAADWITHTVREDPLTKYVHIGKPGGKPRWRPHYMVTDSNTLLDEIIKDRRPWGAEASKAEITVAKYLKGFPGVDDIPVHVVNDVEGLADAPAKYREVVEGNRSSLSKGNSWYDPEINTIVLNQTREGDVALFGAHAGYVVIHELLHGGTAQVIRAARINRGEIKHGGRIPEILRSLKSTAEGRRSLAAADRIEEIYKQTSAALGRRAAQADKLGESASLSKVEEQIQEYGFTNSEEFVAEAFSNPKFQAILKEIEIPTTDGKVTTVWNELLAAVADVFGISLKDRNALAEVMKATHELGVSAGAHKAATRTKLGPKVSAAVDAARSQGRIARQLEYVAAAYEKGRLTDKQFEAVKNELVGVENELLGLTRSAAPVAEGVRDLPSPPTTIAPKVTETFKAAQEGDQAAQTAAKQMLSEAAEAKQLWQEMGTDSPYFQKWFGESVVVDDAGKPLVVYHGTTADFSEFKNPYAEDVPGGGWHMFAEEASYASRFAPEFVGGSVTPVYLSIKNPLDLTALPARRGDVRVKLIHALERAGIDSDALDIPYETDLFQFINRRGFRAQLKNAAQKAGYDGIAFRDAHGTIESTTHVVFEPTQIKSYLNKGMFDPKNPDIQASLAGALDDSSRYG